MVPVRRVERGSLEVLDAGQSWNFRVSELAAGRRQHVELVALATHNQRPATDLRVEGRFLGLHPQAQVRLQPVLTDAVLQVAQDLRLRCVAARPVVSRRERERVEVGGNIAGSARVGVRPPDSADRFAALEDREVGEVGLLEPDAQADPAEAGTDDADREPARVPVR